MFPGFLKTTRPKRQIISTTIKKTRVDVIEGKIAQNVLPQTKKTKKALQLSQEIASLASEGGMKIFQQRYAVLQEVLKIWKLGKTVSVSCLNDNNNTLES